MAGTGCKSVYSLPGALEGASPASEVKPPLGPCKAPRPAPLAPCLPGSRPFLLPSPSAWGGTAGGLRPRGAGAQCPDSGTDLLRAHDSSGQACTLLLLMAKMLGSGPGGREEPGRAGVGG